VQLAKVKQVATDIGVSCKGSKLDIISRLQHNLKDSSLFRKVFSTLWGSSGIYLRFRVSVVLHFTSAVNILQIMQFRKSSLCWPIPYDSVFEV